MNAHCFNTAASSAEYRESLREAEFVLPDGSGVMLASKLLHLPIRHNLNGTDLTPRLCKAAAQDERSIYLLGSRPGVAEKAAETLAQRYPKLRIAGVRDGYFRPEESAEVVAAINEARPDMLLVALGVPRQELWITEHFDELDVPVCLAVGALLDFLSHSVPRAPMLLRKLGIEWLYRLYREPRRLWKRYLLGNATFLSRVFAVRLGRTPKPARPRTAPARTIPASGMLLAAPKVVAAPAPYEALPVPQRGNMRWSAAPLPATSIAARAVRRDGGVAAQRQRVGAGERAAVRAR